MMKSYELVISYLVGVHCDASRENKRSKVLKNGEEKLIAKLFNSLS